MAWRLVFRAAERALSDEEIERAMAAIVAAAATGSGARLRA